MTQPDPGHVSRRQLFSRLASAAARSVQKSVEAALPKSSAPPPPPPAAAVPLVAWINPAECLAFGPTVCTVCSERCPEPGAITLQRLRPTVNVAACTGCKVCQDVCPAPRNAVTLVPHHVIR